MGSGALKTVELSEVVDEEWSEFLTIDVKLKCSKVLKEADFWHCAEGIIPANLKTLNQEFNLFRGLFPLRILIAGPPASGKSHYASLLAQAYGVPHVTIKEILEMTKQTKGEFKEKIDAKVEELKD